MKNKFLKIFLSLLLIVALPLLSFGCSTADGKSAYEIAVENGFEGTEQEWLGSLKAKSNYEIAVENGFEGTEQQWLLSLKEGKSAYEIAVENGFEGTEQEWLASLSTTMEDDIVCACARCTNQVVEIYAGSSYASGVVYEVDKENGTALFLTCYHVVLNSNGQVYSNIFAKINNTNVPLTVVGGRTSCDIALLRVENNDAIKSCNLTPVTFANSVDVGETCIAIGNPKGLGITCTTGTIGQMSSLQYFSISSGVGANISVLIHSASTTTGNSGGGLFNTKGELVGITNGGKTTDSNDSYFIKFAIPLETILSAIENN